MILNWFLEINGGYLEKKKCKLASINFFLVEDQDIQVFDNMCFEKKRKVINYVVNISRLEGLRWKF